MRTTNVVSTVNTTHRMNSRMASRQLMQSASGSSTTSDMIAAKCSRKNPSHSRHSESVPFSITFISRPEWVPVWKVSGSCMMCSK